MLFIYSCMPFLIITTIPKYLNFAVFPMVYLQFLQYCRAALDVNPVILCSKILLHLQDKPFSFSSRSHVCIPSVPHLVIYSDRRKGPSLKDLPENNTTVSKPFIAVLCYNSHVTSLIKIALKLV